MELFIVIVALSILLSFIYILNSIRVGKYKIKNSSLIQQKSIEEFKKEYPEKDIRDLKIEIEKISDMLLDNQDSNRYTKKLQYKAKNDSRLDIIKRLIPDNVEIINYNNGKMKAHVNYILGKKEYTLVMNMNIVKKGRAFLKKYQIIKRAIYN